MRMIRNAAAVALAALVLVVVAGHVLAAANGPGYARTDLPTGHTPPEAQRVVPGTVLTAKPTPEPARPDIVPCAEEDSPGPCFWDAAARGNRRGRSFVVLDSQEVIPVTAAYAAALTRTETVR